MSVFVAFEREMIVERVAAGLARARAEGKRLGRPKVAAAIEAAVRADHAAGKIFRPSRGSGESRSARCSGCWARRLPPEDDSGAPLALCAFLTVPLAHREAPGDGAGAWLQAGIPPGRLRL